MSLTGFVLNENGKRYKQAIASIDGNICRCTGYKSIERAAQILTEMMNDKPQENHLQWLVENGFIPGYFLTLKNRLEELKKAAQYFSTNSNNNSDKIMLAGGTDLIVQKPLSVKKSHTEHVFDTTDLKGIRFENGQCHIGASTTATEFAESELMQGSFPKLNNYMKLVSSTPIRNMATLAGNLVNASPIGDITIFFLALDSTLVLNKNDERRTVKLKNFYKAYKQIDKETDEFIETIIFSPPAENFFLNFEKYRRELILILQV